jgi:formylglycine-generating enzyme required for sulfatase activity
MSVPTAFISSTAQDLVAYRAAAREAAQRAGFRVIGMESFEGRDERPLSVCKEKVAQADVVVAIVAHRYGWVPPDQPPAPDGSRDRSITWLECEQARALGKAVLAFIVEDKVSWPAEHMDAHTLAAAITKRAAPEERARAERDVQRLDDFKRWLDEGTRPRFTSPDDLSLKVLHSLVEWERHRAPAAGQGTRPGGAAAVADPRMYLEVLAARTGHIDIRGLQVGSGKAYRFPIDELYIPLTTTGSATAEGQPPSSGTTMQSHGGGTGPRDRDRRGTPVDEAEDVELERPRPIALDEALRRERLVIVGDPGSGKTTFLNRVAHTLCQAFLGVEADAASRRLGLVDRPFPILVQLADLAEHVMRHRHEGGASVPVGADAGGWLPHFLGALGENEAWGVDEAYFRAVLEKGPCVALLDGLDEAPDRVARESLSRLVENLARAYPKARMVVTSRPGAYVGATVIPEFAHVHIEPLELEAVRGFLAGWSEAIWPGAPREAARHREELTGALRVPEITRLARNPVMLTALAVVHWNERRLPEQRADLYESIIKWLSRARERRAGRPSAERCVTLLQELALAMQAHPDGRRVQVTLREGAEAIASELNDLELRDSPERRRLEAAERFLVDEELDSGIIVGRGHELTFWHLTFQEFLAARAIAARPEAEQRSVLLAGDGTLYTPEWREVVLLLAGVLHQHGRLKLDGLVAEILTALGPEPSHGAVARCVGLLGAVQRDLAPFGYEVRDGRYRAHLDRVMAIFDAEGSRAIPIEVRIEAADALGQAGDARLDPANPGRWVAIEAGTFTMGAQRAHRTAPNFDAEAGHNDAPVHEVELGAYRIGRYPVTVGEYRRFVDDGGYDDKAWWPAGGHARWKEPVEWAEQVQYPSRPVVRVSWYEAAAFCAWAGNKLGWGGCRLPTEAEWERAARGREARRFPWGNEPIDPKRANYGGSVGHPTPVGVYPHSRTSEGVDDMAGNVWEWCFDRYGPYEKDRGLNPTGVAKGEARVLRGGSWGNPVRLVRSALRNSGTPSARGGRLGFRVVVAGGARILSDG